MPISRIGTDGIEAGAVTADDLADGAVTSAKMATAVQPIGVGQTWQDVKASRTAGTTYTNSTGRPIQVCICINQYATTSASSTLTVNGVVVATWRQDGGAAALCAGQVSVVIPAGATYVVSSFLHSLASWAELR